MNARTIPAAVSVGIIATLAGCQGFRDQIVNDAMPGWHLRGQVAEAWVVKDGVLECTGGGKLWGEWLGTDAEYTDFAVEMEYKMSPGGNSGVNLRCPTEGHPSKVAMEIQLLDDTAPKHAKLVPSQFTGAIYKLVAPTQRNARPLGEWNHLRVTAVGDHITVLHNGRVVVDADAKSCPEILTRSPRGAIGLQNHHTPVWFRNIRIADLGPKGSAADYNSSPRSSTAATVK